MLFNPAIYASGGSSSSASIDFIKCKQYAGFSGSELHSTALWCESYIFGSMNADVDPITSLAFIDLPECVYIGCMAFCTWSNAVPLTVSLPKCEYLESYAFDRCFMISSLYAPMVKYIGSWAFPAWTSSKYCHISSLYFPACSYIETCAFYSCYDLRYINMPECLVVGSTAFISCSNIEMHLPKCQRISGGAFDADNVTLYLDSVISPPVLQNDGIFRSNATIYVQPSMYSAFISATYWSLISSRIYSIA